MCHAEHPALLSASVGRLQAVVAASSMFTLHVVPGVAELGGPGGPWPPQKFEWVGQGMFWPPQNFNHWPTQNGLPVVKLFAKLLLSTLKCA